MPAFYEMVVERLECPANHWPMTGDYISADVSTAQACEIRAVQVRSGISEAADLPGDVKPFAVIDAFADLPGRWGRTRIAGR